jgi:sec-independent protein translocase protein TatB
MFDIGFPELILLSIVALLVLGPERMPEAVRTAGLWLGRLRRNFSRIRAEIEREVGMDDVRRQLHNESVLEEIRRLESEVQGRPAPSQFRPDAPPNPAPGTMQEQSAETTRPHETGEPDDSAVAGSKERREG